MFRHIMIPVVDFSDYALGMDASDSISEAMQRIADKLCNAFSTVGFVYLKNHGIPQGKISEFFDVSKKFFEGPVSVKEPYVIPQDDYFGWMGQETESLDPKSGSADLKESYNFNPRIGEQATPVQVIPSFFEVYNNFYKLCQELTYRIMDLMCIGLNLDRVYFRHCHQLIGKHGNLTSLRSLYYPPITSEIKPGQLRCGQHTDYSTVTLLFQDDVGGLQVKPSGSDFISAESIPGTILVNLGALMQRWTADRLLATEHRVIVPETEIGRQTSRQSAAFFVQPDDHAIIGCLDQSNKYEPISALDYLNMRFRATY